MVVSFVLCFTGKFSILSNLLKIILFFSVIQTKILWDANGHDIAIICFFYCCVVRIMWTKEALNDCLPPVERNELPDVCWVIRWRARDRAAWTSPCATPQNHLVSVLQAVHHPVRHVSSWSFAPPLLLGRMLSFLPAFLINSLLHAFSPSSSCHNLNALQ